MNNVQERLPAILAGTFGAASPVSPQRTGMGAPAPTGADVIRRFPPTAPSPWQPVTPPQSQGIIQQLLQIIEQLLSALGLGGAGGALGGLFGGSAGQPNPGDQYFQSATASSTGDPHLAYNATTGDGQTQQAHYNSMSGHNDLLDSDSFNGGYQIATAVTQPNQNGITYNQSATITTNYGGTQVMLDNAGDASVVQNGQTTSLANGQSLAIGNGETVTRNNDGSLVISDDDGQGGSIATTLSENGQGVNVNTQAQNVDLGGDIFNQAPSQAPPLLPLPIVQTY